jgi:parvulin-like peptidyl-prolyl isomerase
MLPLLPVAAAIVCVLSGPATSATRNPATPVITVNGAAYTARDFDRLYVFRQWYYEFQQRDGGYRDTSPAGVASLRRTMVRELVERQLKVLEATRRGLSVTDAEIAAAIAGLRKEFKSEAVFLAELAQRGLSLADARTTARETLLLDKAEDALTAHVVVTQAEIAAYYHAHREDFRLLDEEGPDGRLQTLDEVEPSIRSILLHQHRQRALQAWVAQQLATATITYAPGFAPQAAPTPDRR